MFNIAQALENCVKLCKIGGQILQAVPANGECGHGFWQMSPELFFSLYSERNGFIETEVFIANLMENAIGGKPLLPRRAIGSWRIA